VIATHFPEWDLSIGAVPGTLTHLKWSLVPPDFKDIHENCSKFNKRIPPANSEVLVDLKNIENPDRHRLVK